MYRAGKKNANADYLSRPVKAEGEQMVRSMGLEEDLDFIAHYPSTSIASSDDAKVRREIKEVIDYGRSRGIASITDIVQLIRRYTGGRVEENTSKYLYVAGQPLCR